MSFPGPEGFPDITEEEKKEAEEQFVKAKATAVATFGLVDPKDLRSGPVEIIPQSESAQIMQAIMALARDNTVDVQRLETLLNLHSRVKAESAEAAFAAAFADMQQELPIIDKAGQITGKGGESRGSYALKSDMNKAILPILGKHGFSLIYRTTQGNNHAITTAILRHRDGHKEESSVTLPYDTEHKNAVQAVGSAMTYGERYTMKAILNLTIEGDAADDDGTASGGRLQGRGTASFDLGSLTKSQPLSPVAEKMRTMTAGLRPQTDPAPQGEKRDADPWQLMADLSMELMGIDRDINGFARFCAVNAAGIERLNQEGGAVMSAWDSVTADFMRQVANRKV